MKHLLLLLAFLIAATALTSGEYSFMVGSTPTPNPEPSPNTTTPHPNTTTPHPNTTTPHPNTTTHNPNVTTISPNATTHNPNVTTISPNATTQNPNTTTSAPPIPSPTPPTNLTMGSYNVSDDKGNICIMANMAIGIRVNNNEVNGTFIIQPSKTTVEGQCWEKEARITLIFDEGVFNLKFRNNDDTNKVYVEKVQYDLTYAFKTKVSSHYNGTNSSLELFSVDLGHSYSCTDETVYMGSGVTLELTKYRIQAFKIENKEFGKPELCKADQPDYRVPIAVGVILIILIIIVVIAYLISRRRRTDGYQSL